MGSDSKYRVGSNPFDIFKLIQQIQDAAKKASTTTTPATTNTATTGGATCARPIVSTNGNKVDIETVAYRPGGNTGSRDTMATATAIPIVSLSGNKVDVETVGYKSGSCSQEDLDTVEANRNSTLYV